MGIFLSGRFDSRGGAGRNVMGRTSFLTIATPQEPQFDMGATQLPAGVPHPKGIGHGNMLGARSITPYYSWPQPG